MFYYYRDDAGTEVANAVWKILAASDRVAVASGAHLYSTGAGGRLFAAAQNTSFNIAGELVSDGATIAAFDGTGFGISVTVQASGSVFSANNYAIYLDGGRVVNDGMIDSLSGVLIKGGGLVTNGGTISAAGPAVTLGQASTVSSGQLDNTGTIVATAGTNEAVALIGSSDFTIVNSGEILAASRRAITATGGFVGSIDLTNTGTIGGHLLFGSAATTITNSGTIAGRVTTGNTATTLTNTGTITGPIVFGSAADRYDGHDGGVAVTVSGGGGDDTLLGGSADDVLNGGTGEDYLDGGAGRDAASYADATSGVTVDLADAALNTGEAFGDTLVSIERLIGGAGYDQLFGTAANERLDGGGAGDGLFGRGGDDILNGGDGEDFLVGGTGRDRIDGGAGIDTVSYADATAGIDINLFVTGWQQGGDALDRVLNVENIIGSAFADQLRGTAFANRLEAGAGDDFVFAGAGDDYIVGGPGADYLDGGDGFDTVDYGSAAAKVTVVLGSAAPQDTGGDGIDRLIGIEKLIGSAFGDKLTGDALDNVLEGGNGADVLLGGSGNDILLGGDGIDDDRLNGGGGIDTADYGSNDVGGVTVSLAITTAQATGNAGMDTLTAIENLFGGAYDDTLTGDALDNVLRGRGGINVLRGGAGSDTADYGDAGVGVSVSLAITGAQSTGISTDTLLQIENLTGGIYDDTLTGNEAANVLNGGNGADILTGNGGNDRFTDIAGNNTFIGGLGIDTADYSNFGGAIVVDLLNSVDDTVVHGFEFDTVSVDNFVGTPFGDIFIWGPSINGFTGGGGADTYRIAPGTADQNTIRDFSGSAGDGDKLVFENWDSGFTFFQVDATHWRFSDAGGNDETITFTNGAIITSADIILT